MIPNHFRLYAFVENCERIKLLPTTPEPGFVIKLVQPVISFENLSAGNIGSQVLELASHINLLIRGVATAEEITADSIPKVLGYPSWGKLKKATNNIDIVRGATGIDDQMVRAIPMFPYGNGTFQYIIKSEDHIKHANVESELDIGQAVLDSLEAFK